MFFKIFCIFLINIYGCSVTRFDAGKCFRHAALSSILKMKRRQKTDAPQGVPNVYYLSISVFFALTKRSSTFSPSTLVSSETTIMHTVASANAGRSE